MQVELIFINLQAGLRMLVQIHGVNLHNGMVMVLLTLMQISTIWHLETTILQKKFLVMTEVFIIVSQQEHPKKFLLEILIL